MNKKKFINFRQPSDISEEEMGKIFAENDFKTVGDLMIATEYDVWKSIIETGEIFDIPVSERFWGLDEENTVLLIERIKEIDLRIYDDRDENFNKRKDKWLDEFYQFWTIRKSQREKMPVINTKQQLLLIHYMEKAKLINLNKIHQDQTKQAQLLSMLFGKGYENIYKELKKITSTKYEEEFDKILYLQPIYELFTLLGIKEIANEIKNKIEAIQAKFKK